MRRGITFSETSPCLWGKRGGGGGEGAGECDVWMLRRKLIKCYCLRPNYGFELESEGPESIKVISLREFTHCLRPQLQKLLGANCH